MGQTILYALPASVLVVAAAASLFAQKYVFPAETKSKDWRPAAAYVRDHIRANDIVRTHPPWNIDALPYLESIGDQIDRKRDPLLEDLYRYDRVWVLSERERAGEALEHLPFRSPRAERKRFGNATVWRAPIPEGVGFSWEALEHLSDASVERLIYKDGKQKRTRTCENWDQEDRRWDCGNRDRWLYVGETFKFIAGDPRRAIWAHPLPKGNHLRVTFPEVPLEETLRVRGGFTHLASRRKKGDDVHLKVAVDGQTRIERTFPRLETEWKPSDIDTGNRAGETASVQFEIWTSNFRDRYFCFNAWIR